MYTTSYYTIFPFLTKIYTKTDFSAAELLVENFGENFFAPCITPKPNDFETKLSVEFFVRG